MWIYSEKGGISNLKWKYYMIKLGMVIKFEVFGFLVCSLIGGMSK